MKHLLEELEKGYLNQRITQAREISKEINLQVAIGGSTALVLYGLIPYREPKDLDLCVNIPKVDLNSESYMNIPFSFEVHPGGYELSTPNTIIPRLLSSQELLEQAIQDLYLGQFNFYRINDERYDSTCISRNGVDIFYTDPSIINKYTYMGEELLLCSPRIILNARLRYGINNPNLKETIAAINKLETWECPFKTDMPF